MEAETQRLYWERFGLWYEPVSYTHLDVYKRQLLDEATASLDVENETKVQGALSRLLVGKTVLVIACLLYTSRCV